MSEKLQITCVCGYENWVSPQHLGETVSCAMCGADLAVDEAAAAGHFDSADADEYADDEPAPESPTNPPHPSPMPPEGLTLEERVEGQRRQRSRPLSPFDADEDGDQPPRAEIESRAAPVPRQPKPRARNPFEAEEPEPEKTTGSGPFTLTPDSASKSGLSYTELMEETRPKERRDRHVVVQTLSPHDALTGEKCSECGRELRGSWDRFETGNGVICYVCSNQAIQGTPERLKVEKTERRELSERDLITQPVQELPVEDVPWYREPESPEFKRVVWFLAVFTLLLGAYFFFFDRGSPPPASTAGAPSEAVELTPFSAALLQGWQVLSFFGSVFLAVYVALRMDNATPHGKLLPDVLFIGAICVPVTIFYYFMEAVRVFLAQIPMAGGIFWVLIGIARWLIILLGVTRVIHIRFSQLLIAGVLYFVFNMILFRALGVLMFRDVMGII